uniref:Uncharacterized protein n=1 Tax=Magnetococcus massalia (strain MO-1) TaxID=451514 RepID=A0A1S7LJU3_MAGMO|nr:protein of unknown function [Candidatus Magnetococcus massalia]
MGCAPEQWGHEERVHTKGVKVAVMHDKKPIYVGRLSGEQFAQVNSLRAESGWAAMEAEQNQIFVTPETIHELRQLFIMFNGMQVDETEAMIEHALDDEAQLSRRDGYIVVSNEQLRSFGFGDYATALLLAHEEGGGTPFELVRIELS